MSFFGGIGGAIGNFLSGGGTGGYQDMQGQIQNGMNALNQNYGYGRDALNPWAQGGQWAMGQYQNALGGMADPQAYYNHIMDGYQMSPGAQFQMKQGQQGINNAAAAGGTLGSGAEQKAMDQYSQGVANQDQQQYFQNQMGINNQYMGGLGNMMNQGYGAAGQMNNSYMNQGNALANEYNNMGTAQYGQNTALWGGIGDWIGKGLNMAGMIGGM